MCAVQESEPNLQHHQLEIFSFMLSRDISFLYDIQADEDDDNVDDDEVEKVDLSKKESVSDYMKSQLI